MAPSRRVFLSHTSELHRLPVLALLYQLIGFLDLVHQLVQKLRRRSSQARLVTVLQGV
jgi:hypothetical protein